MVWKTACTLTLTRNKLQEVPSLALRQIQSLETLYLDNNQITDLGENTFHGFGKSIKFLWLQKNK